jgi:nucleoid-associated protein YgaU
VCHYQGVIMKVIPWLVILSLGLVGCSGSKSAQPVSQETPQVELSDSEEFIDNPSQEAGAEASDAVASTEEPIVTDAPAEVASDSPLEESSPEINAGSNAEATPVVSENYEAGSEKTYQAQKNETLMMIAFKLYGDYRKWKELANNNQNVLKGSTAVREGMNLKYTAPAEEFVWNPQGLPYLIRTGDTLGGISTTVYQTPKKWKMIWENNRPLIKDPNKIFAGFTLYYLENGREVASDI